jgi:hypothetical protein
MHRFAINNPRKIKNFVFKHGDLVLVRNTAVEKSLDRKMHPRYLGPYIIISRNTRGAYILAELDGTILKNTIGAFVSYPTTPANPSPFPMSSTPLIFPHQNYKDANSSMNKMTNSSPKISTTPTNNPLGITPTQCSYYRTCAAPNEAVHSYPHTNFDPILFAGLQQL